LYTNYSLIDILIQSSSRYNPHCGEVVPVVIAVGCADPWC